MLVREVSTGSCRDAASRPPRRGCRRPKRNRSPTVSLRGSGGAEAFPPAGPVCRCTALASPPVQGGGCGGWNRRSVPVGGTWMPSTLTRFSGSAEPTRLLDSLAQTDNATLAGGAWVVRWRRLVKFVPGCRRTAPASLPSLGRGCGARVRPRVAARSMVLPSTRSMFFHLVVAAIQRSTPICLALCLPARGRSEQLVTPPTSCSGTLALGIARGPTRGWASPTSVTYIVPPLLRVRRRLGHRATVRGVHRRHASPYVGSMVQDVYSLRRGATPRAEPTHQKRGPWRLHGMSRQGRLPNLQASLRRGSPRYFKHYKNLVNTELLVSHCRKIACETMP
jgi:hypothetical protein